MSSPLSLCYICTPLIIFFLDIEECQDGMDICQNVNHAECENTAGSYYCYCDYGYDWNEGTSECDGK